MSFVEEAIESVKFLLEARRVLLIVSFRSSIDLGVVFSHSMRVASIF